MISHGFSNQKTFLRQFLIYHQQFLTRIFRMGIWHFPQYVLSPEAESQILWTDRGSDESRVRFLSSLVSVYLTFALNKSAHSTC